jgi:hypothetical protein
MSAADTPYAVTLHHLASDVTWASATAPDVELKNLSAAKLRMLIESLATLAPAVQYPAAPEIRITAPGGRFLVQVKDAKVKFTSWALRAGGTELTPQQMIAAITGEPLDERGMVAGGSTSKSRLPKGVKVALLAVVIVGSNAVTAWVATKPPMTLLPPYRLMDEAPAQRLLTTVAGDYETGKEPGDRALSIKKNGAVRWTKLGPDRAIEEDETFATKPVQVGPNATPGLLADKAVIEVKDPITVVFYGDTYRRKVN